MSLHRSLILFMAVLAAVTLTGAISLILVPTYVHQAALELQDSLRSIQLAQEIQVDLLNYVRMNDAELRLRLENDLREKLGRARTMASALEEDAALKEASASIETHFDNMHNGVDGEENLARAFAALQQFVTINVGQADSSVLKAASWDRRGDWIGIGSGALLAASIAAMLIWLRVFALQPVFDIRNAMKSFSDGTTSARAPDRGSQELRSIAAQFNDMAETLTRQPRNELQFLSAVAHDLRNPIAALNISAQVLASDRAKLPENVSGLISIIERQVGSLDRMVGDLLDRSRIESGQLDLWINEHDARKIAKDAFDLFSSTSPNHRFVLHIPDSPVLIHCDPFRMQQVLNNLISNAIKYSPAGGDIELDLKENHNKVRFQVSDHGLGIPKEELPYIFEPFRRVRTAQEGVPGVGLGLSVVRRIVNAHHGSIEVDSRVGEGTTFRVDLPCHPISA